MVKRIKTIALIGGVYLLSFLGAALLMPGDGSSGTEAVEALAHEGGGVAYEASAPASYILREYEGNLCVFYKDIPAIFTEISVESLRGVDRAMIENGIEVSTKEEVWKLLEDFGS